MYSLPFVVPVKQISPLFPSVPGKMAWPLKVSPSEEDMTSVSVSTRSIDSGFFSPVGASVDFHQHQEEAIAPLLVSPSEGDASYLFISTKGEGVAPVLIILSKLGMDYESISIQEEGMGSLLVSPSDAGV